jgi:hypothetical protein
MFRLTFFESNFFYYNNLKCSLINIISYLLYFVYFNYCKKNNSNQFYSHISGAFFSKNNEILIEKISKKTLYVFCFYLKIFHCIRVNQPNLFMNCFDFKTKVAFKLFNVIFSLIEKVLNSCRVPNNSVV